MEQKEVRKKYDAWLQWRVGFACILKCEYCESRRLNSTLLDSARRLAESYNVDFRFIIKRLNQEIAKKKAQIGYKISNTLSENIKGKGFYKINIPALMDTFNKSKKIFRIGFSAGEPFLVSNITEACAEITKNHFVSFNTNLVSGDIKNFIKIIEPERVIVIHASLHIKELERLSLINTFIDNFNKLRDKGVNIYAQEVGYPPLAVEAEKYRQFFRKRGIEISFGAFIGSKDFKNYPESYTDKELNQLGLDSSARNMFNTYGKICNAGYNFAIINSEGGIVPCEKINITLNGSHIYKKIRFNKSITVCPIKFCSCPYYLYDTHLFNKALTETKNFSSKKSR